MNYLSQITIDRSEAARQNLYGLYNWHKFSWSLFPNKNIDDRRNFLTRIDADEHEYKFTVLSENKPEKPAWCIPKQWKEISVPDSFYQKDLYLFKILTNPTKTLSRRDPKGNSKKNGSHYAITRRSDLLKWFIQKSDTNGFRILDEPELEISPPIFHKLYRKKDEGALIGVEFKGALAVTDRSKFLKVVFKGLGRARGFGFGLLVLKPIS